MAGGGCTGAIETAAEIRIDVHLRDGALATIADDVREGLGGTPKELPPKYFYDERGSQLFEQITRLPEYYPTRAEQQILDRVAAEIVSAAGPSELVELGPGSARKTHALLDPILQLSQGATYVPVDVSESAIRELADRLVKDRKRLEAAYNDSDGVTAEFNRNVLRVVNANLDGDLDPGRFDHVAFYDERRRRIEMRLRAHEAHSARIEGLGMDVVFEHGEEIRTEISCKFTRPALEREYAAASLDLIGWYSDDENLFALSLTRPT